jgi:hypothetical protein
MPSPSPSPRVSPSPSPTPKATSSATLPLIKTATKSATPASTIKSASSAAQFTSDLNSKQPQLELKYIAKEHNFTVIVSQTKEASYLLRYVIKQDAGEMEFALSNQALAVKNTINGTHFAGTESSGQKVPHDPLRGVLELTAVTLDDKPFRRDYTFKLNARGEITSLEIASHSGVLGESTESAEIATPAAKPTQAIRQSAPLQATVASGGGMDVKLVGMVIGAVVLIVVVGAAGWMWWKHRGTKKVVAVPSDAGELDEAKPEKVLGE